MVDRSEFTSRRRSMFGRHADSYEAGRPGYPPEVFELLHSRCGLGPGLRVLEIGPGTGQATAPLLDAGARVTAVEIAQELADRLTARFDGPGLDVIVGDFETVDFGLAPFDLVAAATSFHWVDPERGLHRVAELLRSGGWVALWWNCYGDPDVPDPFVDWLRPALQRHAPGLVDNPSAGLAPHPYALNDDARRRELDATGRFRPADRRLIRWTATYDPGQLRRLFASFTPWMELDEGIRTHLLEEVERLVIEEFGGAVERSYLTAVYTARRH